jgi:hypothetical protein
MPSGPKLVIAFLMVGLVFAVFWFFAGVSARIGDMLGIVVQIALLIGLYTRQSVAWSRLAG